MKHRLTILFIAMLSAMMLHAKSYQSNDIIKHRVEQYLLTELQSQYTGLIKVNVDKMDPRLQLPRCKSDQLEVFNPYQTPLVNTTTMGIRCLQAKKHWTLYVPTVISIEHPVVVAKQNLIKGQLITNDDLAYANMDINRLKQGYFTKKKQVAGQVSRLMISQGSPLLPGLIEQAMIIRKGQQVTIMVKSEVMKVSMLGVALSDGAADELIKVKNLSSNRIIEARVSNSNEVEVSI